ncbi:uncharacterized protein METZ01_LOCUS437950, partial [marine metagenome]
VQIQKTRGRCICENLTTAVVPSNTPLRKTTCGEFITAKNRARSSTLYQVRENLRSSSVSHSINQLLIVSVDLNQAAEAALLRSENLGVML